MLTPEKIREIASAFQESRAILTAFELRVFSLLGKERKGSKEIAAAAKADERAMDRLMDALCAMGLLQKQDDRFSNTTESYRFLAEESPDYWRGFMHLSHLWNSWSGLTDAVRRGGPAAPFAQGEDSVGFFKPFIAAMHERAGKQAEKIASMIDLPGASRILDVGGGSGVFSMAFLRRNPGATATVFDLQPVTEIARGYIEAAGMSGRIGTAAGDFNRDELGTGYDLVFVSAIIHMNTPEKNRRLVEKCAKALNPGGRLAILDFVMGNDRTEPKRGALFALNMLVGTQGGDTYTLDEISSWLQQAGLEFVSCEEPGFDSAMVIARKG